MTTPHEVRGDDPLVRWLLAPLAPGTACIADGAAVAWVGRASRPGERWITALGDDPIAVAGLVRQLAAREAVDGITVTEGAFEHLPTGLRSPDPGHWCLWTLDPAATDWPPSPAEILAHEDPRIAPLLRHSASAHVFPGDPRVLKWAGVEDEGRLVAVAGSIREASGALHLVSVCTEPEHRGRGLAGDVCRRLIQEDAGAPMIVLEMYAGNAAGRRVYTSLGFEEVGRYRSGLLTAPTLAP